MLCLMLHSSRTRRMTAMVAMAMTVVTMVMTMMTTTVLRPSKQDGIVCFHIAQTELTNYGLGRPRNDKRNSGALQLS